MFTGTLPKMPGTWGTLFGALVGALLLHFLPQSTLFLLVVLITVIGIKEINIYEAQTGIHDDPQIVIDEIAGIWLAYSILPDISPIWLLIAFVLFRILDITKPSYIKRLDNLPGGIGVMGDDLLAGLLAGLLTGIIYVGASKLL